MIAGEMSCPRCRATNRAGANFCRRCGVLLEGRCPRGGQERVADSDFCDNCGLPLSPQAWLDQDRRGSADAGAARPSGQDPVALAPDLRQYIPRELKSRVDAAQANGGMVGERRIVTMLFCDIKGSTAMAGHLDPEEWADVMKGTVEHLVTPVYRYEGTVAQLLGDGILAFFGAPIAHEASSRCRASSAPPTASTARERMRWPRCARSPAAAARTTRSKRAGARRRSGSRSKRCGLAAPWCSWARSTWTSPSPSAGAP